MSNLICLKYKNGDVQTVITDEGLSTILPKVAGDSRGLMSFSSTPNFMVKTGNKPSEQDTSELEDAPVMPRKAPTITGESLRDFCKHNHMEYILDEWDTETNKPFTPDNIKPKSGHKVSWVCPKCGLQWFAPPATRTNGSKCRRCRT